MPNSIDKSILFERYQHAREYLVAANETLDWLTEYERFKVNDLSVARTMTLLLPESYGEEPGCKYSLIRGRRAFNQSRADQMCQSELYWGYVCPFQSHGAKVADHSFPYALGGVTEAPNLLWLCSLHNRLKGSDVHIFPWERGLPRWVPGIIDRIALVVRSRSRSH